MGRGPEQASAKQQSQKQKLNEEQQASGQTGLNFSPLKPSHRGLSQTQFPRQYSGYK